MDKTLNLTLTRTIGTSLDLWVVRGDEELEEYNFMSRTAAPDWGYLPQTPCIFRFSPKPEPEPTEYRVIVDLLESEHIRINNYDGTGFERCWNYLFSVGTGLFNNVGYPKMLYAVMAGNILRGVVEGNYLKFKTLIPTSNTLGMSHATHPDLVHEWDIIMGTDQATTRHTKQCGNRGIVYNFLVSKEGYGYLPLKNVKRKE